MTIRRVSTTGNRIKLLSGYHKVGSYLTRRKSILGVVRGEQERFVLEYLVVGGGGGGGAGGGGGGGGGGVIIGSLDAITTGGNVSIGLTGATVFSMGIGAITGNNQDARGNDGNATTFAMSGPNGFSVTALGGGAGGKETDAPNTTLANRNPGTVAGGGGQGLNSDHTRSQANQGGQGGIAKVTGRDGPAGRSTTESEGRSGGNPVETTCLSGSISGDVLTLDGPSGNFPGGYFSVGMTLHGGPGNNPDAWLTGTIITEAISQPVAPGGQGTYRISPAPQTVTPRQINAKMNPRGYGGGGGGGSGHTPGPQGEGGNGGGGFDSPILGFNRGYAGGGGGASSSPNNNAQGSSGYGGGYGSVKDGGDEKQGKARDHWQVLANGGIFMLLAMLAFLNDSGWLKSILGIHTEVLRFSETCHLLAIISLAVSCADTLSSDFGRVWGGSPRNIITGKRMIKGVSGGVTGAGFVGAFLGAVSIAIFVLWSEFSSLGSTASLLWIVVIFGFMGSVIDSVLGVLFQAKYLDEMGNQVDSSDGGRRIMNAGFRWVTNDVVNGVTGILMLLVAVMYLCW
jgi:uncharacterized membrane protein